MTGRVLSIQRMSTEDGPGLRTTVFLKGCPLRCTWCHNPEGLSPEPELVIHESRCIGCGTCREVCPRGADSAMRRDGCTACGKCVRECPAGAREVLGVQWSPDDLVREVARDSAYFGDEGGVTLSGGEPTLQAAFAQAFVGGCARAGLRVALDTCGACPERVLLRLADQCALVLYDVKVLDPDRHRQLTGAGNERILANLSALARVIRILGRPLLWVRTPLVPGATATRENISGIGRFLATEVGPALSRWDLCAFNNLCRDQYRRLGRTFAHAGEQLMTREALDECLGWASESGVDRGIVRVTGAARA